MSGQPPEAADADIAAALVVRDHRRTLTLLMDRHGDRIYSYCRRMVGDERAADVHQQVFVDAFRGLAGFDGRASPATWLFAIARRRCIDVVRALGRRRARDPIEPADVDQFADPAPPPWEQLDQSERLAALTGCIDELAPATRSAVLLRYQERLPYDQLAEMFDEPANTIGRRVARAIAALRVCVERRLGGAR